MHIQQRSAHACAAGRRVYQAVRRDVKVLFAFMVHALLLLHVEWDLELTVRVIVAVADGLYVEDAA